MFYSYFFVCYKCVLQKKRITDESTKKVYETYNLVYKQHCFILELLFFSPINVGRQDYFSLLA